MSPKKGPEKSTMDYLKDGVVAVAALNVAMFSPTVATSVYLGAKYAEKTIKKFEKKAQKLTPEQKAAYKAMIEACLAVAVPFCIPKIATRHLVDQALQYMEAELAKMNPAEVKQALADGGVAMAAGAAAFALGGVPGLSVATAPMMVKAIQEAMAAQAKIANQAGKVIAKGAVKGAAGKVAAKAKFANLDK